MLIVLAAAEDWSVACSVDAGVVAVLPGTPASQLLAWVHCDEVAPVHVVVQAAACVPLGVENVQTTAANAAIATRRMRWIARNGPIQDDGPTAPSSTARVTASETAIGSPGRCGHPGKRGVGATAESHWPCRQSAGRQRGCQTTVITRRHGTMRRESSGGRLSGEPLLDHLQRRIGTAPADRQIAVTRALTASLAEPPPVEVAVTSHDLIAPFATPLPTVTRRVMSTLAPGARLLIVYVPATTCAVTFVVPRRYLAVNPVWLPGPWTLNDSAENPSLEIRTVKTPVAPWFTERDWVWFVPVGL